MQRHVDEDKEEEKRGRVLYDSITEIFIVVTNIIIHLGDLVLKQSHLPLHRSVVAVRS